MADRIDSNVKFSAPVSALGTLFRHLDGMESDAEWWLATTACSLRWGGFAKVSPDGAVLRVSAYPEIFAPPMLQGGDPLRQYGDIDEDKCVELQFDLRYIIEEIQDPTALQNLADAVAKAQQRLEEGRGPLPTCHQQDDRN